MCRRRACAHHLHANANDDPDLLLQPGRVLIRQYRCHLHADCDANAHAYSHGLPESHFELWPAQHMHTDASAMLWADHHREC
jgi:hypothetical protein